MKHKCLRKVEISIPSELGYEKTVMAAVTDLAQKMDFSTERIDNLKTALSEAVINAIEHGNQLKAELGVQTIACLETEGLVLKVVDQARCPLPSLPAFRVERADNRGWGLLLIQNLMDEVKAITTPGRNELQMIMYR